MKVDIQFYVDKRAGRTVAISFNNGSWYVCKWEDLPDNIKWLLAEMSVGEAKINTEALPWLTEWQNGK